MEVLSLPLHTSSWFCLPFKQTNKTKKRKTNRDTKPFPWQCLLAVSHQSSALPKTPRLGLLKYFIVLKYQAPDSLYTACQDESESWNGEQSSQDLTSTPIPDAEVPNYSLISCATEPSPLLIPANSSFIWRVKCSSIIYWVALYPLIKISYQPCIL